MIHIILNAALRAALRARLRHPRLTHLERTRGTSSNEVAEPGTVGEPAVEQQPGQPKIESKPKPEPQLNGYGFADPEDADETMELRKLRLSYESRRRGIIERNDLLSAFAEKYLERLTDTQTAQYEALIKSGPSSREIYYWATNAVPTPPQYDNDIMTMLKQHVSTRTLQIQPNFYE